MGEERKEESESGRLTLRPLPTYPPGGNFRRVLESRSSPPFPLFKCWQLLEIQNIYLRIQI